MASGGSGSSRANTANEQPLLGVTCARVARFAREERLFRRVSKLLVAVSGGPDSLALLLVLRELRAEFDFQIEACHFDHQLRPESSSDRDRVRAICEGLGVGCVTGEGDVRSVAAQNRASIEETARTMRYQFLAFVAAKERCDAIATGHTADDQAETVLMRIIRGSGVRGIRGMLPSSGVPGAPSQRLIRPLLCVGRPETAAICAEAGLEPLVDKSNDDVSFARNRVRHETLLALRAVNPSIDRALRGLASSAREVFEGVERESMAVQPRERTAIGAIFATEPFAALQDEARTLVIEREAAFHHLEPEVNRTRVENLKAILRRGTGEVLFGDTLVEVSCGSVRVGPPLEAAESFEAKVLNVPGTTIAGPWRVDLRTEPLPGALAAEIDSRAIRGTLRVRQLAADDRMSFRGIQRRVHDVLANEKVPRWERHGAVAVADSEKVLALFTASGVIADKAASADCWHVRVGHAPAR